MTKTIPADKHRPHRRIQLLLTPEVLAWQAENFHRTEQRLQAMGLIPDNKQHYRGGGNSCAVVVNGERFESAVAAGLATGISERAIRDICNGHRFVKFKCSAQWA